MKIIASIFLILVGFLIIQPAMSTSNPVSDGVRTTCSNRTCCEKKQCSKKAEKEKSEPDCSKCNPFMACAYGNFFVNELPFDHHAIVLIISTDSILTNDKAISSYTADCWHPPKEWLS
ncbi:MAG TPA: hypothetical protein VKR53_04500 [Puia sp.]|nr:hypothetical protein [Puia sp.]